MCFSLWRNCYSSIWLRLSTLETHKSVPSDKMSLNGVLQLKKLTVFYSSHGGSSAEAKYVGLQKDFNGRRGLNLDFLTDSLLVVGL